MIETDEKRPRKQVWMALISGILTGYAVLLGLYFTFA
jgi:hypothetical protein